MFTKSSLTWAMIVAAVLSSSCGSDTPTTPSGPPVTPAPRPAVVTTWIVTASLMAAEGNACAKEAVQSLMDATESYTLSLSQAGDAATVTLRSASGNFACTYPARIDESGFTSRDVNGYYTCAPDFVVANYRCSSGRDISLHTLGQDIAGKLSGDEISGTWEVSWFSSPGDEPLETSAHFTGRRQ